VNARINPQVLVAVRRAMRAYIVARQKAALAKIAREIREARNETPSI
jgi:hypothetical protein